MIRALIRKDARLLRLYLRSAVIATLACYVVMGTLTAILDQDLVNGPFAVAEAFCFYTHTLQERQQQVIERALVCKSMECSMFQSEIFASGENQRVISADMRFAGPASVKDKRIVQQTAFGQWVRSCGHFRQEFRDSFDHVLVKLRPPLPSAFVSRGAMAELVVVQRKTCRVGKLIAPIASAFDGGLIGHDSRGIGEQRHVDEVEHRAHIVRSQLACRLCIEIK